MRTVLSLVFLAAILWASCTVKLGAFTLSEHVDRIGETPQAKELLDGTRGRISPVLEDMKQRIFGEYVEAPTRADKVPARAERRRLPRAAAVRTAESSGQEAVPARAAVRVEEPPARSVNAATAPARVPTREPSSPEAARLPGGGRRTAAVRREGA